MADGFNTREQFRQAARAFREQRQQARQAITAPSAFASMAFSPREEFRASALGLDSFSPSSDATTVFDKIPKPVAGALRGLASFLEPVQLLQDGLFAITAGALDPDSTIAERLGRMNLKAYLPGGEAPERPASGEEIFRLMGFDGQVSKWAGIAADLVVDPLLFGVALRSIGKIGKIDELIRVGNAVDRMTSPVGALTEANKFLRRSESFRKMQEDRIERVLSAIRNPESEVFGIQRFGEKASAIARRILPRDRVYQLEFGQEVGRELFQSVERAKSLGGRVARDSLHQLERSMFGVQGDQNRSRFALVIKSIEEQAQALEANLGNLRPVIREVVDTEVHRFANQQVMGTGVAAALTKDVERIASPELRRLGEDLQGALRSFTPEEMTDELAVALHQAKDAFESSTAEAHRRIGQVIRDDGARLGRSAEAIEIDVRQGLQAFDDYLRDTLMIDASIGFHTSGYADVANAVRSRVLELGGSLDDAQGIWHQVLRAGMVGEMEGGVKGLEAILDTPTGIMLTSKEIVANREAHRRMRLAQVRLAATEAEYARIAALKSKDARRAPAATQRAAELLKQQIEAGVTQTKAVISRGLGDLAEGEVGVYSYTLRGLPESLAGIASQAKRTATEALRASVAPRVTAARARRSAAISGITPAVDKATEAQRALRAAEATPVPPSKSAVRRYESALKAVTTAQEKLKRAVAQVTRTEEKIKALGKLPRTDSRARVAEHTRARLEVYREDVRKAEAALAAAQERSRQAHAGITNVPEGRINQVLGPARKAAESAQRKADQASKAAREAEAAVRVTPAPTKAAQDAVSAVYKASDDLENITVQYLDALETLDNALTPSAVNEVIKAEERIEKALTSLEGRLVTAAKEAGVGMVDGVMSAPHPAFTRLVDALDELLGSTQSLRAQVRAVLIDPKRQAGEFLAAERSAAKTIGSEVVAEARAGIRNINEHMRTLDAEARKANEAALARENALAQINYGAKRAGDATHLRRVGEEAVERAKATDPTLQWHLPERMPPLATDGNNTTVYDIISARMYNAAKAGKSADATMEAVTRDPVTIRELLEGSLGLQALPLGEYLKGLMNGHLRKTYGLFLDAGGFQRYVDRVNNGSIIMSRVIDEDALVVGERFRGLERELQLFSDYRAILAGSGNDKVLMRSGIIDYMASHGSSGERIDRFLRDLHASLNESDQWQKAIALLNERRLVYEETLRSIRNRAGGMGSQPRVTNKQLFDERAVLSDELTTILGENTRASIAILESASQAERVISRQKAFQAVLDVARERGLLKNEPFTDLYGGKYVKFGDDIEGMAGFSGKWVSPFLVKELQRLSQVKAPLVNQALARVRSLITGGYLASPAVLSANIIGGFYQASLVGMAPWTMAQRMAEVLPDMRAAARGERTQLMDEIYSKLDMNLTTLVSNESIDTFAAQIRKWAEMGPEGVGKMFDDATTMMENFLQAPGLGRFKARWAGLEGFQFTENWFKAAAYKDMRDSLLKNGAPGTRPGQRITLSYDQAVEQAAEYARTVVFDYSTLPDTLEHAKKFGFILFPGFPYYLAGRTIGAALERPGVLAASDRITEAMMNISLDPAEQVMMYLGMPEWMRQDQGAPVPFLFGDRRDANGNKVSTVIPMAQLIPTGTIWDGLFGGGTGSNPWAQSLSQLGLWGPLIDVVTALTTDESGEAIITGRFGHKVFDPDSQGLQKAADVFRFLYNTMAPSVIRKGIRRDYQDKWVGAIPAIPRMLFGEGNRAEDSLAGLYSIEERRTGRPEDTWREDVMAAFIRSPQVVALEGPLAGIREEMEKSRTVLNDKLSAIMRRYRRAKADGHEEAAQRHLEQANALRREFNDTWREYVSFYRAWQEGKQQQEAR